MRPIGDWSMSMTLSISSQPTMRRCFPGRSRDRYTFCISARSSTSCTSVDLPEPETPVTATNSPSGIATSMFLRLCSLAPRIFSQRSLGARRICGVGMTRRGILVPFAQGGLVEQEDIRGIDRVIPVEREADRFTR